MPIFSVSDITAKPLSKYLQEDIIKDLDELKQNGGINKKSDFDKIMKYFMKKSFRNVYNIDQFKEWTNIYLKIFDMYSDFSETYIYYLFEYF